MLVSMDLTKSSKAQAHGDNEELVEQILSDDSRKKEEPVVSPPLSPTKKIMVCLGSVLLPPLGLIWGIRYLRRPHRSDKVVGLVAIVLTIISIVVTTKLTLSLFNRFNEELNQELLMLEGL